MMNDKKIIGGATLYLGDCKDILPNLEKVDAVVTDPPYPDYHQDLYEQTESNFLQDIKCRQFIFWSNKAKFPLDYTSIHIWDKKTGAGSEYERIFERNGQFNYKVFRFYLINSSVAANFTKDIWTGHPSQKPIRLIESIINLFPKNLKTILDPFMGSGTTGVACMNLDRHFIGIEKDPEYFDIACKRISDAEKQFDLFNVSPKKPEQLLMPL